MTTVAVVSSVRAKEASEIKSDNVFIAFRGKATSLKDANRAATNYLIENDADFKPEKLSVSVWLKPSSKTEHVEFSITPILERWPGSYISRTRERLYATSAGLSQKDRNGYYPELFYQAEEETNKCNQIP